MLEIPESNVMAEQINKTLCNKTIRIAKANQSPHKFAWYSGNPETYEGILSGRTITGARAVGGQLEIILDELSLVLSDGAILRYYTDKNKAPVKNQLYLEFDDGTVCTVTIAMYACIFLFYDGEIDNEYYKVADTKPSPLTDAFDLDYFRSLRDEQSGKLSLKAFLATKQRIPGLGNGVLQDILYQARMFPKRKMNTVSDEDYDKLFHTIKNVLKEMTDKGGRETEKDLYGNCGGYITYLSKNTLHTPCPRCGHEIHKEAYLGGVIYYCEECQK